MLTYQTYGDGACVRLLLHGFLGSGRNLSTLARRWVEADPTLCCVTPDLTGHGTSPPLAPDADLKTLADDALALMAKHPWRHGSVDTSPSFHVVGHSLGGRVALSMLAQAPSLIASVTLLDIAPGPFTLHREGSVEHILRVLLTAPATAASREQMRQFFLAADLAAPLVDWLLMNLQRYDDSRVGWRIDRSALAQLAGRFRADDLWPVVVRHAERITCIRGSQSPYVSDEDFARMRELGCTTTTIANAGHFLHVDQLDALLSALQRE